MKKTEKMTDATPELSNMLPGMHKHDELMISLEATMSGEEMTAEQIVEEVVKYSAFANI